MSRPASRARRLSEAVETKLYSSIVLTGVMLRRSAYAESVLYLRELQRQWSDGGYREFVGLSLEPISILAALTAQPELATQLYRFCIAYENQTGSLRMTRAWLDEIRGALRDELGEVDFALLSEAGARMTMNGAVALAATALDRVEQRVAN